MIRIRIGMAILPCLILATCLLTVHGTPLEWGKTISAFQCEEGMEDKNS